MKTPKIVNAMQYIDDDLIVSAERQSGTATRPVWIKWAAMAAAFVLVFSSVFTMAGLNTNRVDAVVALDVNPSIELEINKNEEVVKVNALNEDAKVVLGDMNFKKLDVEVAVNAIIGSMLKNGYLSVERNSILVSVDAKDDARAEALQNAISADIEKAFGAGNIEASVLTQTFEKDTDTEKMAEENHISAAKAALVDKIVKAGLKDSKGVAYSYEALAHLNVHELKMILESKEIEVNGLNSSGTAKSDAYIGKEKATALAFIHAGLAKDETDASPYAVVKYLQVEMDYDDGLMLYSVEFETETLEYEYEIDAKTGKVVEFEKEANDRYEIGDRDDDDDHDDRGDRYDRDDKEETTAHQKEESTDIGKEKATMIAFMHAGLAKSETDASPYAVVKKLQVEKEYDDGRMTYSVEFETAEFEYEYEIDAKTGKILDFEKEEQDD